MNPIIRTITAEQYQGSKQKEKPKKNSLLKKEEDKNHDLESKPNTKEPSLARGNFNLLLYMKTRSESTSKIQAFKNLKRVATR